MGKNKIVVCLMTAVLLLVLALAELILIQRENVPFSVEVASQGGSERIECWREDGCYYVFLPTYAQPEQVKLVTNPLFPVWIEGKRVESGTVCGEFPFEEALSLTYQKWGKTYEQTVFFCQSTNVPTLYIDTASGSMDHIHQEKGNAEAGSLRLYTPEGTLDCGAQIRAINGRGNATWETEKKPYSVELTQKADLLGMGQAKKWILLANRYDNSNIANKMCFDFAAAVGCAYTPQCQWVDLYLNGEYAGLYLLSERNEVDDQRVDIAQNGSFLLSMEFEDRWDGTNYSAFFSRYGNLLRIHHDGMGEDRLREVWQSAEDAICSEDGLDALTGKSWDELIDVESWARQYLMWEVFAEYDAGCISKFFYYDPQEDRVFAGPLWDMDNILNRCELHPANILAAQRKYIWNRDEESLFYRLYQKEEFRDTVKRLYREEYRPRLLELAERGMEEYLTQCLPAARLNRIRWEMPAPAEEVTRMEQYLKERVEFLDEYWTSEEDYCVIEVSMGPQWRSFAVRRGETAEFLPSEGVNWVDYETGEPFDVTTPVTRDRVIQKIDDAQ
ncbi:MAG: CotH kinase family protein [Eubacteriales bacterium]|nr:CotH kinase family protein [Eubacteriales bacterium]